MRGSEGRKKGKKTLGSERVRWEVSQHPQLKWEKNKKRKRPGKGIWKDRVTKKKPEA